MKIIVLFFSLLFSFAVVGQVSKIDSLRNELRIYQKDSDKKKQVGLTLHNIGKFYRLSSGYDSALTYYAQALELRKAIRDTFGISSSANNIAIIYRKQGKLNESLSYYLLALKSSESLSDPSHAATYLGSISMLYFTMGNNEQSATYLEKGLRMGDKKFAYDIWGDTVNTASRMESSGESNKINVSGGTYQLVKEKFTFEFR